MNGGPENSILKKVKDALKEKKYFGIDNNTLYIHFRIYQMWGKVSNLRF